MRWGYVLHVSFVAIGIGLMCHLTGIAPASLATGTTVVFLIGGDILQRRWMR